MYRLIVLLICLLPNVRSFAQGTLQFCERVDESGQTENCFESLIVSPGGQTIYLFYKSTGGNLNTPQVKLEIAQLKNHSFQRTDLKSILCDPSKEKLKIPFIIKNEGDYRFRLQDDKGTLLAEEILSVSVEMSEPDNHHEMTDPLNKSFLPEQAEIQFSEVAGNDYNTEFSFRNTRGIVRLTLDPFYEIDPTRILDIWQNENGQYKLFIRSEKATFLKAGNLGIYEISFPGSHDYKVNLYNTDNILITSGFVSFK